MDNKQETTSPSAARLDEWAVVYPAPTAKPFELRLTGGVFRGMNDFEAAKRYADTVQEFWQANGVAAPVFVVSGPTSTTRCSYEVVSATSSYSVLYKKIPSDAQWDSKLTAPLRSLSIETNTEPSSSHSISNPFTLPVPMWPAKFGDGMVCQNKEELEAYLNGIEPIPHGSELDTQICFAVGELSRDRLEDVAADIGVEFNKWTSSDDLRAEVIEKARMQGGISFVDDMGKTVTLNADANADASVGQASESEINITRPRG